MGRTRVFLACPVYGQMPLPSVTSFVALAAERLGVDLKIVFLGGESFLPRARNRLTADFLESGCDKLLFVDSDIGFTPQDVERIASHDEPVVGGFVRKKVPGVEWAVLGLPGTTKPEPDARGLARVARIGTGFMCIRRDVFDTVETWCGVQSYCHHEPPHARVVDFWSPMVVCAPGDASSHYQVLTQPHPLYLAEDWAFCELCTRASMNIYGDTQVILDHVGQSVWHGRGSGGAK